MYKNFFVTVEKYYHENNDNMGAKIDGLDNKNNYKYHFQKNNLVEVYLGDKLVMKGEYCTLGLYSIQLSVWYWSWAIAFINKQLIELPLEKVKKFVDVIDNKYEEFNKKEVEMLHYLVSNNNFYISNDKIDKIIKLGLYLTKSIWCFPIAHNDKNQIEYILITKILQY